MGLIRKSFFAIMLPVAVLSGIEVSADQKWSVANQWGGGGYTVDGDFDGNGIKDVASAYGGNIYMKLGKGDGMDSHIWTTANRWGAYGWTRAGDFNGDGLDDLVSLKDGSAYMSLSTGVGFIATTWSISNVWGSYLYTFAGDFNGDGLADIASAHGGNVYMKFSTSSGFSSATWSTEDKWGGSGWTRTGDFNGDGKLDIVSLKSGTAYVKLNTGSGFKGESWPISDKWGMERMTFAEDFNGDGKTDIISVIGEVLYVKISSGNGFTALDPIYRKKSIGSWSWYKGRFTPTYWGKPEFTFAGDFTASGGIDIVSFDAGNAYLKTCDNNNCTYEYSNSFHYAAECLESVYTYGVSPGLYSGEYFDNGFYATCIMEVYSTVTSSVNYLTRNVNIFPGKTVKCTIFLPVISTRVVDHCD